MTEHENTPAAARDVVTIRTELEEALQHYQQNSHEMTESQWRPVSDKIATLQNELAAALTQGAVPCARCGAQPHALRHVRATARGRDIRWQHVYEVGCLNCYDGWQWVRNGAPDDQPVPGYLPENSPAGEGEEPEGWVWKKIDMRGWGETPGREDGSELDRYTAKAARAAVEDWNERNQGGAR